MSASRFVRSVWTSFIEAGGLEGRLLQNLKITDVEPGRVKFELGIEKYHTNRLGILHGGTIATMVDLGGSLAIASLGFHATGVSTDLNITYINSGGKVGQIIRAESICEKCGSENRWHTPASHSTTSPINWLLEGVTPNTSARHGRIHGTSLRGHPKLLYNIIMCLRYYYEDNKRSLHPEFDTSNGIEATFEMALTTPDGTAPNKLESLKIIIRDLLRTVREKFGVVAIEPQLTKDHFDDTIRKLPELCSSHNLQGLLECATKEILYDIAIEPLSDERFSSFCNLLDLALVLTELELTDVSLPFILIEELFDSQTIDSCQQLFEYLESRVERLTTDMEGTKGKGLVLLRLCNEVLRRLSKAEDTIFCGRILIFLSKSFILGERSGVNLRGEFNIENTTSFDQLLPATKNEEKMDIDQEAASGQARVGTSEGTPIDGEIKPGSDDPTKTGKVVSFETPTIMEPKTDQDVLSTDSLYPVFWSLQNFFSNPTKLFVKESFEMFKAGLAATMAKFKAVDEEQSKQGAAARTADEAKGRGANSGVGEKRKREDLSSHFNPKYLTSRELFELELSDLTFRRHILVQALILIDFLLSLTPAARERWADIPSPNKAVQYSFTLSPDDEKWATKTRLLISEYLQPNFEGRLFMRLVETILTRDKNWVQWKAENCVSFEKKPVPEDEVKQSMDRAMELCRPTRPYPHAMGAPALGRLWRDASKNPGMEGLKRKERHTLPTPESFRPLIKADEEEIADALRPDQAEAAATSKASKVWRALRIASRDRFHLFNKFVDTPDEDRNELEMLFDIEESEQEAKRIKLEESLNSGTSVNRDRLSTVPDTQQIQQQRTQSPSVGEKRAMSAPSTVPALSSDEAPGEARCREAPTEGSAAQTPVNGKIDSQPPQRIENIANLSNTNANSHQPEVKLHNTVPS